MNKENQQTKQLSARQVDSLIYRAENLHEITDDRTKALTIELFQKLQSIAVCGDDERRELWLIALRGSFEEYVEHEEFLDDGELDDGDPEDGDPEDGDPEDGTPAKTLAGKPSMISQKGEIMY